MELDKIILREVWAQLEDLYGKSSNSETQFIVWVAIVMFYQLIFRYHYYKYESKTKMGKKSDGCDFSSGCWKNIWIPYGFLCALWNCYYERMDKEARFKSCTRLHSKYFCIERWKQNDVFWEKKKYLHNFSIIRI